MNTIFWKGVFSTTIDGLLICELPSISKPPLRVTETTVDGRDGSIIEELGYSAYDKSITIGLHGNFDINKVIKYFTGEGEIVFSNEPDKVYTAKVINQIDYNRLLRFRTAVVTFRVQPFKHKYNEAYKETQTVTATGTSVVANVANANLKTLSIYGKSTQNGTPTPDAPVDIVSLCADGTVAVTANNTVVNLAVANGLRGIPVTDASLATYTDSNGQMWCADEIDLVRGVLVRRIYTKVFTGTEAISRVANASGNYYQLTDINVALNKSSGVLSGALCSHLVEKNPDALWISNKNGFSMSSNANAYQVRLRFETITTESALKSQLTAWHQSGTPLTIVCRMATPIETALTDEEIEVCGAIRTITQDTNFSNDEGACMNVEQFKPFEVFNEGLETSKPIMVLHGSGTVGVSVNGIHIFDYTFPEGETEVVIDSEKEDAYLGSVLKNRNMNGEFPVLLAGTNKIEWSGDVESIEILPRSRWL